MPRNSQLSRYGAITKALEQVSPYSKVFFVGDSDDTGFVNFVNEFPPDEDGVVRVYGSIFDSTMLANARAGRGDVIMVMPGHLESITADQALTVKGLKVIGLGEGDERPRIQYDNAAGSISLDTGGIHLENLRLIASVTAVTRGIDVVGDGCVVRKCSLEFDATGDDFAIGITASGNRPRIEDNDFLGEDTTGPTHAIQLSSADYATVRRNRIFGQFSNAGLSDTAASNGVLIENNRIVNSDTAASISISLAAATTGLVSGNHLASHDSTAGALSSIATGGARWIENYATDGSGVSGIIAPVVTSS